MSEYSEVVQAHAQRAVKLYAKRLDELGSISQFVINADGSNMAQTHADAMRYLGGIEVIGGEVAGLSAKMAMQKRAKELGVKL